MKTAFIYLILFVNFVSMLHLALFIVGGNIYDIKQMMRKRSKKPAPKTRHYPLVSVIVPAHDEVSGISKTLDSILASTYKNIEVIVVDDGSADGTASKVDAYWAWRPDARVSQYVARLPRGGVLTRKYLRVQGHAAPGLTVRQHNQGKGAAMNNAIQNYAKGEYVMCLDADSQLDSRAIERVVEHLEDPTILGVAANVRIGGSNHWLTLLQRFEHMIGYRAKKFYTVSNSEFIIGGVASTYRRDLLKKVGYYDTDTMTEDIGLSLKIVAEEGNKAGRIIYAADVVAVTEGVQTFSALMKQRYRWKLGSLQNLYKYRKLMLSSDQKYSKALTTYRLPMAVTSEILLLLGPLLMGYLIWSSITHRSATIFLGAYMTTTLYTLWAVWPDEHYSIRQKLTMSVQSLFIYMLFFAMDVVQLAAIIRVLANKRKVTAREQTDTTWVSPARLGAEKSARKVLPLSGEVLKNAVFWGRRRNATVNTIELREPTRPYAKTTIPYVLSYKNRIVEATSRGVDGVKFVVGARQYAGHTTRARM